RVETPARYYVPRRSESLVRITRRWGTSTSRLRSLNGLGSKVSTVRAGTRLLVRPASVSTVVTDASGRRRVVASQAIASRAAPAAGASARKSASPAKTPVARSHAATGPKNAKSGGRVETARALRIGS